MSTLLTLTSSSVIQVIGKPSPGESAWPPLGDLTWAVGASPPLGPARPRCLGTCITMQWMAPARPMMPSQLIWTMVLVGSAAWRVERATALLGATVPLVYDGIITTSLHMTMFA